MKNFLVVIALVLIVSSNIFAQGGSDAGLRRVTEQDAISRDANGKLQTLTAAEHLQRAESYSTNRLFPQAREHWQKVFDNYPADAGIPKALFGTARSFMWERQYEKAVAWFDRLIKNYPQTTEGSEGLAFKGASLVRLGKNLEAVTAYEQYTVMFPDGKRIESAHLNIIDAYREAGKYDEANRWVDRTRNRFPAPSVGANALQARVRMEIFRQNWVAAVAAADELLASRSFSGSMTSADEAKYLKAFALQMSGKKAESRSIYASISDSVMSYYGGLASERISEDREFRRIANVTPNYYTDYPVMYRTELLQHAKKRKIDPRFLLAIMKQESSFKTKAKSPAGARGLLQLVYDTAIKYSKKAGYPNLKPDDLYNPATNIAIGSVYVAELKDEFGGLYEAIAASYNGGEDNAARWLNRSKRKEAGIFASEVGFAETKAYLFKVMNNYRVYRELYTEELQRH